MTARVSILLKSRASLTCFQDSLLVGLRTYYQPGINVLWSAWRKGLLWNPSRISTVFGCFGCSLNNKNWRFRRHSWQPLFDQYTSSSLADAEFGVCRCSTGIKWSQKGWISSKNGSWRDETFSRGRLSCQISFPATPNGRRLWMVSWLISSIEQNGYARHKTQVNPRFSSVCWELFSRNAVCEGKFILLWWQWRYSVLLRAFFFNISYVINSCGKVRHWNRSYICPLYCD